MPFSASNPLLYQSLEDIGAWRRFAAMSMRVAETTRGDDVVLRSTAPILPGDQVLAGALKASCEAFGNAITVGECGRLLQPNRSAAVEAMAALPKKSGVSMFGKGFWHLGLLSV